MKIFFLKYSIKKRRYKKKFITLKIYKNKDKSYKKIIKPQKFSNNSNIEHVLYETKVHLQLLMTSTVLKN